MKFKLAQDIMLGRTVVHEGDIIEVIEDSTRTASGTYEHMMEWVEGAKLDPKKIREVDSESIDYFGNVNLKGSNITEIFFRVVTGDLNLSGCSSLDSLNWLHGVGGDLDITGCNISRLGYLEYVNSVFAADDAILQNLDDLRETGGIEFTNVIGLSSLGNLKEVNGDVILSYCALTSLGALTTVKGDLYIEDCPLSGFGKLKHVGGNLEIVGDADETKLPTTEEEVREQVNVAGKVIFSFYPKG